MPTLLVDHAHCEKRAASTAVRYLFKYPDWPALVGAMSRLAREELVHFERVLKELEARGVPFRGLASANYAAELFAAARSEDARARKVDEMLCCALIEARSHERFVRLAAAVAAAGDERLAKLYGELAEAEARHGELYVELAVEAAGGIRRRSPRRIGWSGSRDRRAPWAADSHARRRLGPVDPVCGN